MKLVLGAAALAAALAVPAHAQTVSGIKMTFALSGTCASNKCTVTVTNTSCVERTPGPRCSVDPITVTLINEVPLGAACVVLEQLGRAITFVHTEAFGDVALDVKTVYAGGEWVLSGVAIGTGVVGVLATVGGPVVLAPLTCSASFTVNTSGELVILGL